MAWLLQQCFLQRKTRRFSISIEKVISAVVQGFFSRFCGVVATTIKEAQGNEDAKKRTTTRSLQL